MMALKPHWWTERRILLFAAILIVLAVALLYVVQQRRQTGITASNLLRVEVAESGFYLLTGRDLRQAGFPISQLAYAHLALSQNGEAIPYYLAPEGLLFYGQAPTNRYTAVRPYLLQFNQPGQPMAEAVLSAEAATAVVAQVPIRHHLEENWEYEAQTRQLSEQDLWFWQTLPQGAQTSLPLDLTAVGDGSGTITFNLWGVTNNPNIDPDHDFEVHINDQPIGQIRWDGSTHYTGTLPIPAGILQNGTNTLVLDNSAVGASPLDIMQLNWVDVTVQSLLEPAEAGLQFEAAAGTYSLSAFSDTPLLFDLSQPRAPRLLIGWQSATDGGVLTLTAADGVTAVAALTPDLALKPVAIQATRVADWHNPQHQADLIILTTDELAPPLAPLVAARQAQGLTVAVVPVEEVYAEFGFGEATPQVLQEFLAYAYTTWQTPPRYVLIVGDASSDYRNYLGLNGNNLIPSPMVAVAYSGETVSDSRLVDVDGDIKPEMAIGRWPVSRVSEVSNLVERTLAYEQGTAVNRAIFAADATEDEFAVTAQRLIDESAIPQSQVLNGPTASQVIQAWNEGAWLAAYVGHGSIQRWGKNDVLSNDGVGNFTVATPPIVVQLTCLSGLFAQPDLSSLSEILLGKNHGPVLLIGATSLTLSSNQEPFARALFTALQTPDVLRMGDAFQVAKRSLDVSDEGLREISDTFVLFGDPSAVVQRP